MDRKPGVEQDQCFWELKSSTTSRSKGRERVSHKREADDECSSLPQKKGNFVLVREPPAGGKIERQLDVVEAGPKFKRQWSKPLYSSGHDAFKRLIEDDAGCGFLVATKRCRLEDAVGWSLVLSRPAESVMVLEDEKVQDIALSCCISWPEFKFKLEPPKLVVLCDVKQWVRERLVTALPLLENARGSMESPRVEVLDSSDDEEADQEVKVMGLVPMDCTD
jgi:hypothetical protein